MPLNDTERKRIEKIVDAFVQRHRPAPQTRPQLDIGFRISGQSVEIFEIRSRWKEPEMQMKHPVAKAAFVRSKALRKIFWMRADLKWHGYEPLPEVDSIEKFLAAVEKDAHACFWGQPAQGGRRYAFTPREVISSRAAVPVARSRSCCRGCAPSSITHPAPPAH